MKTFRVFYSKHPKWECDNSVQVKDVLSPKFALVKEIEVASLEDVFFTMQGEVWSPNGEARSLIMSLGLQHTSMSVGDVAHDVAADVYWQVASVGWAKINE